MSDGWEEQGILENLDCWPKQVAGAQGILSDGGCAYCTKFARYVRIFNSNLTFVQMFCQLRIPITKQCVLHQ